MAKFFVNTLTKENPDYLIFIKDSKEKNFRHKIYTEYKATREKMPDNLITQIPLIEEVIQKMEIKIIEIA
jgi:DNA polymerase-1